MMTNRLLPQTLRALFCVAAVMSSSAWATLVTWDLNPSGLNATTAFSSIDFTQPGGYTIAARVYNNASGTNALHELSYKDALQSGGGSERSSSLVSTLPNDLASGGTPNNVQISAGNIEPGESFELYGSKAAGTMGTTEESSSDDQTANISSNYQFVVATNTATNTMQVALQGTVSAVPEMSAIFPIIGVITAVSMTQILRRRRAQKRGSIA